MKKNPPPPPPQPVCVKPDILPRPAAALLPKVLLNRHPQLQRPRRGLRRNRRGAAVHGRARRDGQGGAEPGEGKENNTNIYPSRIYTYNLYIPRRIQTDSSADFSTLDRSMCRNPHSCGIGVGVQVTPACSGYPAVVLQGTLKHPKALTGIQQK